MIGSLVHTSYLDELPWPTSGLWLIVSLLCFGMGTRIHRHMVHLPTSWKRGSWNLMAYGLTGTGVARVGWLFDDQSIADDLWAPLGNLSGIAALIGGIWTFERLINHVKRSHEVPQCVREAADTDLP